MASSACKKEFQHVLAQMRKSGVVEIILNRPNVHNAFNDEMIQELIEIFKDEEVNRARLIVLRGHGPSFCAGADINWMKRMKEYSLEENEKDAQELAELFHSIDRALPPVVAMVQGLALGGGAGLASVSDFVLAENEAEFAFSEVRLGIVPAVISPYVIKKVGVSSARAYFTSGMRFSAEEALRMGLVHRLGGQEDLDKVIEEFLKSGPLACKKAKELVRQVTNLQANNIDPRNFTCKTIAELRISDEAQEGMRALLKKEKPNWMKT